MKQMKLFAWMKYAVILSGLCLLMLGCADASETPKDNGGNNGGSNNGGDNNGDDNNGDDDDWVMTIDEGEACPSAAYTKCEEDVLWYCNKETGNLATKDCSKESKVCSNGECKQYANNSCDNPYILNLDTPVKNAQTFTGNTYGLPSACSMNTMMGVTKISVDKSGFYKIAINTTSKGSWGNIVANACDGSSSAVNSGCGLSSAKDEYPAFLDAGDSYLFVGPGASLSAHFTYNVNLSKPSDADLNAYCKFSTYQYRLVTFSDADSLEANETLDNSTAGTSIYTVTDNTKDGTFMDTWNSNSASLACSMKSVTGGREKSYLIRISKRSSLSADLDISYTNSDGQKVDGIPEKGGAAMYIKDCPVGTSPSEYKNIKNGMMACSDTDSSSNLQVLQELDEGLYLLVVDTSNSKDIDYKLTLTRTEL